MFCGDLLEKVVDRENLAAYAERVSFRMDAAVFSN
jgi:hypothetical protein